MAESIKDFIIRYKDQHQTATYEQIHSQVLKHFKGCKTSVASVACTLSRAKKAPVERIQKLDHATMPDQDHTKDETDAQIRERIGVRYDAMARMARRAVVHNTIRSLIISGPPGVGKSWEITKVLKESGRQRHDGLTDVGGGGKMRGYDEDLGENVETPGWYDQISGSVSAPGLFAALWFMRDGGVLILDDCDDVFRDETALNLLKIATDSTKERVVSWRKNAAWLDEYGIDKTFDFKGHIVFLTNIDFEDVIERGHKDSEHFKAIIDRARYLCLTLRTKRDFMIRISDVSLGNEGMLAKHFGLTHEQAEELIKFIYENQKRFYNLSLRLVGQIAEDLKDDPKGWKQDSEATKMRTRGEIA